MLSRICRIAAGAAQWILLSVALAAVTAPPAAAVPSGHGAAFERGPSGGVSSAAFPKWTGAMNRGWAYNGDNESRCADRMGRRCNLGRWQAYLSEIRDLKPISRLRRVNSFVNQVRYRSDRSVWGRNDYWAAPGEFFARGGDCEDYAITKYYSLKALGFDPNRMRIVVVKDTARNLLHAILVVQHGGRNLVLDNLSGRVRDWNELPNYKPLYSINEKSYWLHPGLTKV